VPPLPSPGPVASHPWRPWPVGSLLLAQIPFRECAGSSVRMTRATPRPKAPLMAVAQLGGYGFVYVDDTRPPIPFWFPGVAQISITAQESWSPSPSRNEGLCKASIRVLLDAGLQGKLEEI